MTLQRAPNRDPLKISPFYGPIIRSCRRSRCLRSYLLLIHIKKPPWIFQNSFSNRFLSCFVTCAVTFLELNIKVTHLSPKLIPPLAKCYRYNLPASNSYLHFCGLIYAAKSAHRIRFSWHSHDAFLFPRTISRLMKVAWTWESAVISF